MIPVLGSRSWRRLILLASVLFLVASAASGAVSAPEEKKLRYDLFSVAFPTEKDGWACGRWGTILHSGDGGVSWTRQASGTDYTLTSISFVDGKHGWAVGDGGTIVHTADGGQTWVMQKTPRPIFLMGVAFVNARKGWAVGERTTILHTEDGGDTWLVQFSDVDFVLKSVSFSDEKTGWAVGEYGYVYHTSNGGALWQHQAGKFGFSEESGEIIADNYLFHVAALDGRTAWAVGIDGCVLRTTDGGAKWTGTGSAVPKTRLFTVAFNAGTIVIGGTSLLMAAPEGSAPAFKAVRIEPPVTYGYIYGICPRGKAGFVAVGKDGWIYMSDGSGASWRLAEKR